MSDGQRVREGRIAAAQLFRQARQLHRKALDVRLVQHHVGGAPLRALPVDRRERRQHSRLQRHQPVVTAVERARAVWMTELITVLDVFQTELADDLAGIGIEQQLVRIEPVTALWRIRSMCPKAINQPGAESRQQAAENAILRAFQVIAAQLARAIAIEHAKFDAHGVIRPHGKVDAGVNQCGTERGRTPGQ